MSSAFPVGMSMHHFPAWYPRRPEEGMRAPATGVTVTCHVGTWKKQLVLLSTGPSPQLHTHALKDGGPLVNITSLDLWAYQTKHSGLGPKNALM